MPSGHAPLPRRLGPKNLIARPSVFINAQTRDATVLSLHHVEELLPGVETDLVGEAERIGQDAEPAVFIARQIAIAKVGPQRVHRVLDSRGDRDPDAILRIA